MQNASHFENKLANEIDSWDLFEAQKANDNVVVFDVRSLEAFQGQHIAGAKSFPHKMINQDNTADLDRSAIYVTYCDGIGCNASTAGAMKLAKLGFNVRELIGGLNWWRDHQYPTQTLESREEAMTYCHCA